MSELVGNNVGSDGSSLDGRGLSEDEKIVVGDDTWVLHGADVELRAEDLVVLGEWIRIAEKFLIKLHANTGDFEDFLGLAFLKVLEKRLSRVD